MRHFFQNPVGKCAVLSAGLFLLAPAIAEEPENSGEATAEYEFPDTLDASGMVIDDVRIIPDSIFDLDNPKENSLLYRLANKIHIETRASVIEQQLLFGEGDTYSKHLLQESERLLRSNRFIQDASVSPMLDEDGNVDVEVHTTDTWTLFPRMSFSRAGGENVIKVGLREANLLGRGIGVETLFTSDVDRDSTIFKFVDKHVGNSWYDLRLNFEDSDDGYLRHVSIGKPFYALESTRANGFSYLENERIDSYYDLGHKTGEYVHELSSYDVFLGWSAGLNNGWVRRYTAGVAFDEHRFSAPDASLFPGTPIPADRRLIYPYFGVEWLQDDYRETHNLDQISRTEDMYLGTRVAGRIGYADDSFGSDRNSVILNVEAQTGFGKIEGKSLFLDGVMSTRYEYGAFHGILLNANARYYSRLSDKSLFFASLGGFLGRNLDADQPIFLGGDNGLRGYPLRYQVGDKSVLLTLERRYFTDWYPFRLFRVGGAIFFDAGRVWGEAPFESTQQGWLRDVGIGLRLGSTRSGLGNMIHVDLAYPLDGDGSIDKLQLLVSTKRSF